MHNIFVAFHSGLCALSPHSTFILSLGAVALIGVVDVLIGAQYSCSLFYVAPLAVATHYVGQGHGLTIAGFSALPMFVEGAKNGLLVSHPVLYVWDIAMHLGTMVTIVLILSALRAHIESERKTARIDNLTGVFNRRAFREQLQFCLSLTGRTADTRTLALAYIDLDDFKAINERGGHQLGDNTLCLVAQTLKQSVRGSDVVARLGGDEFALLMPGVDLHQASKLLDKIRKSLAAVATAPAVTCSIGCVLFRPSEHDIDAIIDQADALMFKIKAMGKNSFQVQSFLSGEQGSSLTRSL